MELYSSDAPKRTMPSRWVSTLRRPILSPPGLGKKARPKRLRSGPASITEPRRAALLRTNSMLPTYWVSTSSAWKVYSPLARRRTLTPMPSSMAIRFLMSRISGILDIFTSPAVRRTALMTCRASFLAPWGTISPLSLRPPSIVNVDMDDSIKDVPLPDGAPPRTFPSQPQSPGFQGKLSPPGRRFR